MQKKIKQRKEIEIEIKTYLKYRKYEIVTQSKIEHRKKENNKIYFTDMKVYIESNEATE